MSETLTIYIDADACPVREEVYKVSLRHIVPIIIVSNSYIRIPEHPLITRMIVSNSFDAADDYIAERAGVNAVVITADILLADRCIKAGAKVIGPNGKAFTPDNIGSAKATRAMMDDMRAGSIGENIGGPKPFSPADRSRFLQALHETLVQMKRE
ncbi:MAG: YaiI/YqxD family protein [Robiginitomaculum sp.]